MTAAAKITLIIMASATAFCLWSVAWMMLVSFRMVRDALKETRNGLHDHNRTERHIAL